MATFETLSMFERDNTITPRKLRSIGYIPATIYGASFHPISVQVKAHPFEHALAHGIRHFRLEGLGQTLDVQVKQLQKNNVKDSVLHIEFQVLSAQNQPTEQAVGQQSKSAAAPDPVPA